MMDCIDKMVGIIPETETCPCIVGGLSPETLAKLNESTSGLFLESLEGGVNFQQVKAAAGNCETFASMALRARDAAVNNIKERLITAITERFTKSKEKYIGFLGDPAYNAPYQPDSTILGMRIRPSSSNRNSQLTISSINLATFTPLTTTVQLYKTPEGGSYGTLVGSWAVTTVSQILTPVTGFVPLVLPLNENGMAVEYYLVYDRGAVMPMNLNPTCNCPGVNEKVKQYVYVQGVELSSLSNMPGVQQQHVGGLSMNVTMECRADGLICSGPFDPENPISLVIANALLNRMGEYLIEYVLNTDNINRFAFMSGEKLMGKRNHFRVAADNRLEYIGEVINISASDCFICKEGEYGVPTVTTILA